MLIFGKIVSSLAESLRAWACTGRYMPVLVRYQGDDDRSKRAAPRLPVTDMSLKLLTIILLSAVIFLAADVFGQATVPPEDIDDSWDDAFIILEPNNLRMAEDYQDFVDRLQSRAIDYQSYFAEIPHYQAKKIQHELQKLVVRINKGDYCSDIELLSDDLEDLIAELDTDWGKFEKSAEITKLKKLSYSLKRHLELMVEELNEEIIEPLQHHEVNRKLLEKYLVQKRKGLKDAEKVIARVFADHEKLVLEVQEALEALDVEELIASEEQLEMLEELEALSVELEELKLEELGEEFLILPEVPAYPLSPEVEVLPVPDVPNVTIGPRNRIYIHPSGKPAISRQLIDSIAVTDAKLPIYVKNETGNVSIVGWNRNWLQVQFNVEVLAESERGAKDFTDDIELKVIANVNGVYVKSHFPNLSDPKRKIMHSSMIINAPIRNALVCENSFGTIDITDLKGGVRVNSNYCEVELIDIKGGIEAANKMGSITIVNSPGTLQIKNNLGPISISDCDGDLDIENSYAPVQVIGCQGPLVVRNTGQIEISDHNGQVDIENSNGIVEVHDLRGDLKISNSFRPLIVSDIEGSVTTNNTSATIEIFDIRGPLKAINKYSTISVQSVSGPVELTNENGRITFVLDEGLAGPSFVTANFSTIELSLSDESDVFLTATTEGGAIEAGSDYGVVTDERSSMAKIAFGRGSQELNVNGKNTIIVINDE